MSKVITFSRVFPAYHPKAELSTFFVEKVLQSLKVNYERRDYLEELLKLNSKNLHLGKLTFEDIESFWLSLSENVAWSKIHTIRSGFRFKDGESFSPRCWFGKPYNSPQIIFWEDLPICKTYEFKRTRHADFLVGQQERLFAQESKEILSHNDGLSVSSMNAWFNKELHGQIICWVDPKY